MSVRDRDVILPGSQRCIVTVGKFWLEALAGGSGWMLWLDALAKCSGWWLWLEALAGGSGQGSLLGILASAAEPPSPRRTARRPRLDHRRA